MFKINTIPGQAAQEKGYARYPEDFPHLTHDADFAAWRSGDDWEIETILDGQALVDRWNSFCKCCENGNWVRAAAPYRVAPGRFRLPPLRTARTPLGVYGSPSNDGHQQLWQSK